MNSFKDMGIKAPDDSYTGDKIKLNKILNENIIIHKYKLEKSKYEKGDGQCLVLQIEKNGVKHIIFSGSATLKSMIALVPQDKFPFETVIRMVDDRPQFT